MLIDWFTVIAQAVNFLILVWLLKHFLYRPILNAIDAREKRIAGELADADAKKADAGKERDEFRRKNDEFELQRAALFGKATEEAMAERQRLFDAARKDSDDLRTKQQEALQREYQNLSEEIARRTRAEVFAISRKALLDLAGSELEAHMVDVFVRRLRELDAAAAERLASALQSPSVPVLVRSAFEMPAAQRTLIEGAIRKTLAAATQVRFEVAPDLIGGIELIIQGQKIAWSIADYLGSLEKDVNELLKMTPKAEAGSKPDERAR